MKLHTSATLALPLAILLSGAVIPLVVSGGGRAPAPPVDAGEPRYVGKTAREWCVMATKSLEQRRYDLAIRYLKTAERVEPGSQYEDRLTRARRTRRRATDVARIRERLLGGEFDGLELDSAGAVVSAHRTTVVLPGESLWTLAEGLVAAGRGLLASDLAPGDPAVYEAWDALTAMNGVREFDVGEIVLVPVPERETAAISAGNALDLRTIEQASAALDAGDLDEAVSLRECVTGPFAAAGESLRTLDVRLRDARAERLLASARGILATAEEMSRPSRHGELVGALREARRLLSEAQATADVSAEPEMARLAATLSEAERYSVGPNGLIAATKPPGVAYTDFAHATVEWFLRRKLEKSGKEYPHHDQKTADDVAWAAYLLRASALAEREGVDFAGLLTEAGAEQRVCLPNPADYFAELAE